MSVSRLSLVFTLVFLVGLAPAALAHDPQRHIYEGARDHQHGPGLADGFGVGQLDWLLPTSNVYRTASGAPGVQYWQQEVDYDIDVTLDEAGKMIHGSERIVYVNHSPDTLRYLWLQLEQNLLRADSRGTLSQPAPEFEGRGDEDGVGFGMLQRQLYLRDFPGGYDIRRVEGADGAALDHRIVETMMRVDLPQPLASGESFTFEVDWSYVINDSLKLGARTGYECFDGDDEDDVPGDAHCIFELAHWFPRLAAYTDYKGWQNDQFLGRGEFTLEFGDYTVRITAPADHQVAATGELQNAEEVLTEAQRQRLTEADNPDGPVFIVTPDEARAAEAAVAEGTVVEATRTWEFHAENVRDFAFASSRKFIWDAWVHHQPEEWIEEGGAATALAMSFYPPEAQVLWSKYSTHAIVHTLEVYGRYAFPYPYPVAISVNGPVGGMEYPMISFNGPREDDDGTYFGKRQKGAGRHAKYPLISVIIHEVGHNFFPMIVNSDERQWTWMDEGINSFLQSLAELEWEERYPSRRGEPERIVEYMLSKEQVPIMSHSDALRQFGNNAYSKPATALSVLRHTILGPELFDEAFGEFARRWRFKRPTPADFFRTMEDASGIDLEWFWRGWFYSTDHVDVALGDVKLYDLDTRDPEVEKSKQKSKREEKLPTWRQELAPDEPKRVERYPELKDFYNFYDELDVTAEDLDEFRRYLEGLESWERDLLSTTQRFYVVDFENLGGIFTPILLQVTYADGGTERIDLPAEIWNKNPDRVSKLLITDREIVALQIDPRLETADADVDNNHWPKRPLERSFRLQKDKKPKNPMQKARDAASGAANEEGDGGADSDS